MQADHGVLMLTYGIKRFLLLFMLHIASMLDDGTYNIGAAS